MIEGDRRFILKIYMYMFKKYSNKIRICLGTDIFGNWLECWEGIDFLGRKIKLVVFNLRCFLELLEVFLKVKLEILLLLVWDGV